MFFKSNICQGTCFKFKVFPGARFFKVRVYVLEVAFRKDQVRAKIIILLLTIMILIIIIITIIKNNDNDNFELSSNN